MIGAISTADLLAHPAVTIGCFGWRVFFRAVFAARDETFLAVLERCGIFEAAGPGPSSVVEKCVRLEYEAMRTYDALAHQFSDTPAVNILFAHLAEQEREHAELLEVCARAVKRGAYRGEVFARLQDRVPLIEDQIGRVRASLDQARTVREALVLVVEMESSEINRVFEQILKASESPFVNRLRPFRRSVRRHIAFICRHVPQMEPQLRAACEVLRAALLGIEPNP